MFAHSKAQCLRTSDNSNVNLSAEAGSKPKNVVPKNAVVHVSIARHVEHWTRPHLRLKIGLRLAHNNQGHHCFFKIVSIHRLIFCTQTFVQNQIQNCREPAHTHHFCRHSCTNIQRNCNSADRDPSFVREVETS